MTNSAAMRVSSGRLGVRHAGHRRDAAGHGRGRAGGDGLVLLATRFAEVDVHVNEAGGDDEPGAVEDSVGGPRRCGAEDDAVGEPEIGNGVELARRVDHPAALEEKRAHGGGYRK